MQVILKGWGFNVGANFARATADLPFTLAAADDQPFSKGLATGYIAANPDAKLGFLRSPARIRVAVDKRAIAQVCICGRWPHPSACPYCCDRG